MRSGHRYAFDFHGSIWEASRHVLHARNPYPPPTLAGVAPGDRFVYPAVVAFLFVPLGVLPFPVAAALITAILLAAIAGTLWVLDVRDWRCDGAAYLAIPVLHDVRLGALTPLLTLGLALAWRWRDRTRPAIPLALVVVAKLFLWPLGVWLLATGRIRLAMRSALYALGACALAWVAIGLAGLSHYPRLLQVRASSEQGDGYSPVSGLLALGLDATAARGIATVFGATLFRACIVLGRHGDDRRSLILAVAAALVLSPIVWLHYFVLLLVPIALARRTFLAGLAAAVALLDDAVRGAFRRALADRRWARDLHARAHGFPGVARRYSLKGDVCGGAIPGVRQAVSRSPANET